MLFWPVFMLVVRQLDLGINHHYPPPYMHVAFANTVNPLRFHFLLRHYRSLHMFASDKNSEGKPTMERTDEVWMGGGLLTVFRVEG